MSARACWVSPACLRASVSRFAKVSGLSGEVVMVPTIRVPFPELFNDIASMLAILS